MKLAIKLQDINALIDKHKRGDWVLWEELVKAAEGKLYRFDGVGRINNLSWKPITAENRFVRTKTELAKLFMVSRSEFYRWETAGLITLEKRQHPKHLKGKNCWVYDAKEVEKQIRKQIMTQKMEHKIKQNI